MARIPYAPAREEKSLMGPLVHAEDSGGAFGKTSGESLKRLPSSVYWAGLGTWGIRLVTLSQQQYFERVEEFYWQSKEQKSRQRQARSRGDDPELEAEGALLTWHPRLPVPPESFPEEVNFDLSREEAEFIRDRVQSSCPESLLAHLTLQGRPADTEFPWEHPELARFRNQHQELLRHARLFSEVMHGASHSYNVFLARLGKLDDYVLENEARYELWARNFPVQDLKSWSMKRLWDLTIGHGHTITPQTRVFVKNWVRLCLKNPKDLLSSREAAQLI